MEMGNQQRGELLRFGGEMGEETGLCGKRIEDERLPFVG
jgi:hypothetical protein